MIVLLLVFFIPFPQSINPQKRFKFPFQFPFLPIYIIQEHPPLRFRLVPTQFVTSTEGRGHIKKLPPQSKYYRVNNTNPLLRFRLVALHQLIFSFQNTFALFQNSFLLFQNTFTLFQNVFVLFQNTFALFQNSFALFQIIFLLFQNSFALFQNSFVLFQIIFLLFQNSFALFRNTILQFVNYFVV